MLVNTVKIFKGFAKISGKTFMIEDYVHLAVVGFHIALFYGSILFLICIPFLLFLKPQIGIWFLIPFCWTYYDRNTPKKGGRKSKWFCNLKVFDSLRDYFSTRLIKTADLPKGRNYILAHYPHSVAPFNIVPNFMSNSNKVADIFPEIEMQFVSHEGVFDLPFLRDLILAYGGCSCSESSFTYLLNSKPSKGIIVVPGGASEIQYTKSGSIYTIIKRKGFVRLALTTGTPLVPVFTFGEINSWNNVFLIQLPGLIKRLIKVLNDKPIPSFFFIPLGRGFLLNFGVLPKKVPVNTIVGAPIMVPKVEKPSRELIEEYHEIFFQTLQDMFEKYKYKYDVAGGKAKLIMV